MSKATSFKRAGQFDAPVSGTVTLEHDDRQLRRKLIELDGGGDLLIDLPSTVALRDGDALMLESGHAVLVRAAEEPLIEISASTRQDLSRLCWHIGNRHLPAEIGEHSILIRRDHVIAEMLRGLGAQLKDVIAPFSPERGAYHAHEGHGHEH